MSQRIQSDLKSKGAARVLVLLDDRQQPDTLRRCFLPRPAQADATRGGGGAGGSTPAPDPMLHLVNLGVVYGQVNAQGWDRLQQELGGAAPAAGTPELQPVRGREPKQAQPDSAEVSWGLERLRIPELWQQGLTGRGVLVGHLDTGVDSSHPALKTAIHKFADFDANGLKLPAGPAMDSADHGTHTAGVIAGRPHNGRAIGVAPGCQLVSAAVMEGGDLLARVLAGVDWALNFPVKILNLSLGFPGYFDEYIPLLARIRARGILPVFAVGNEGPKTSRSPGNYPDCVSVGAVDAAGAVDALSSSQRFQRASNPLVPDLVMPGVDIISANAGGGYRADSGTSMAAPHASGLAALLWEAKPTATVEEIEAALFASCKLRRPATKTRANRGMADAVRALEYLTAAP